MYHASLTIPTSDFGGHIHEALDLAVHVAVGDVPPVLPPLATKDTALRRRGRHGRYGFPDQRQRRRLVEPRAATLARSEELVHKGRLDDADHGPAADEEGDGDTECGEEVCIVDGAVEGVYTPRRRCVVDEVFAGCALRVGLLSNKSLRLGR